MATLLLTVCVVTTWSYVQCAGGDQPPRIVEHPSDTVVPRSDPATLNCRASGRPRPEMAWLKEGRPLPDDSLRRLLLPSGSLFFLTAELADAGQYRCVATNRAGSAASRDATFTVAVLREQFRVRPEDTETSTGRRVLLRCSPPKGDPPPTVHWRQDGVQLDYTGPGRRRLSGEGDLVIENVSRADAGHYVCEARNFAGMRRLSRPAQLTVHDMSPPPADVAVRPVNASAAVVSWLPPNSTAGAEPRGYRVYVQSEHGHWTRRQVDGVSTQVTLPDLAAGTNYSVRVTSLSAGGEGASSSAVTLRLPAAADVDLSPGRPALGSHVWLAAVVAAVVLVALLVLAVITWVKRRRDKHVTGSMEKRREGLSLLAMPVRPASWLESADWGAESAGRSERCEYAELSCRALPALCDGVTPASGQPAAPSPYATTALLAHGPIDGHDDCWTRLRDGSRESLPSAFRAASLTRSGRCLGGSAAYSRPHRCRRPADTTASVGHDLDRQVAEYSVLPSGCSFQADSERGENRHQSHRKGCRQPQLAEQAEAALASHQCLRDEACVCSCRLAQPRSLACAPAAWSEARRKPSAVGCLLTQPSEQDTDEPSVDRNTCLPERAGRPAQGGRADTRRH